MRVSVISTVYNGAGFFDRVVPSILGQTLEDFEWIIVDDGSTDRTPQLLAELAACERRVRVLSPGRLGRAGALNLATETARGDYIANQDFDDTSFPERLALQAQALAARPDLGVIGAWYHLIDSQRGERYERMPPESHDQVVRAMASRIPFAHTVVMFRKVAWREAGGYPLVDSLIDFRLWIAIAERGWKLANLPVALGEHFVYHESYWKRNFGYRIQQRKLAAAQLLAIKRLGLPFWMRCYPISRYLYCYLPSGLQRTARRALVGSRERDLLSA